MKSTLSLLALAAACCTSSVWAQSSVQVNGVLDLFAGQRQLAGGVKLDKLDSGGMTTSRIGFEGTEDLGGGLKANMVISGFIRADTGDSGRVPGEGFWRRLSFVGLQGSFGTLRLGRVGTPTFATAIRFNPFADSTVFSPYMLHLYPGGQPLAAPMNAPDSAADNSIAYLTPTLGGFNATAVLSLGETVGKGNRSILGASWSSGPLALGVAGESVKAPGSLPTGVDRIGNLQAGASYDLGVVKLFGQAARSTLTLPAAERKFTTWQAGASMPLGAGAVLFSIASTKKTEGTLADVKRDTAALGYDYTLSKRTDVYAVLLNDKVTNLSTGNTAAVGIRHRF